MSKQKQSTTTEQVKREARAAAQRRLNEAYADELRAYMEDEHEIRGVKYQPRLSSGERAVREVQRLASEHPEVKQALADGLVG